MADDIERTIVETTGVPRPLGAYSQAVTVRPGRLMFIAGQVAIDEEGNLVGKGDFPAQVRQVFHNLEQILASAGASFQNVVQFTTYLVRSQDVEELIATRREIYERGYPSGDYPPNTLLIIDRLVREEFLLEVEAIAALP
jgi:enamine deaminase RidA (YjgF/YER057c/UK114 family)